jgi:hypothetical protein
VIRLNCWTWADLDLISEVKNEESHRATRQTIIMRTRSRKAVEYQIALAIVEAPEGKEVQHPFGPKVTEPMNSANAPSRIMYIHFIFKYPLNRQRIIRLLSLRCHNTDCAIVMSPCCSGRHVGLSLCCAERNSFICEA